MKAHFANVSICHYFRVRWCCDWFERGPFLEWKTNPEYVRVVKMENLTIITSNSEYALKTNCFPILTLWWQSSLLSSKVSVKSVAEGFTNTDETYKHSKVQQNWLKLQKGTPIIEAFEVPSCNYSFSLLEIMYHFGNICGVSLHKLYEILPILNEMCIHKLSAFSNVTNFQIA